MLLSGWLSRMVKQSHSDIDKEKDTSILFKTLHTV